jgi:hypothetical protein
MTSTTRSENAELRFEREDAEVTVDDLRVLIAQLKEIWQTRDHNVMREARTALLNVFHNSAERLTRTYKSGWVV